MIMYKKKGIKPLFITHFFALNCSVSNYQITSFCTSSVIKGMECVIMGLVPVGFLVFYGATLLLLGIVLGLQYSKYYYNGSETDASGKWLEAQTFLTRLTYAAQRHYFDYTIEYRGAGDLKERVAASLNAKPTANKPAIFAASPHGILAISSLFHVGVPLDAKWQSVVPCVHRHVFLFPFVRELACWLGAIDVARKNMETMLRKGHSLYLAPGGCREMILDAEQPIQTRHKGFLRMAWQEKCPVFPVIHTGQDEVFHSYTSQRLDKLRACMLDLTGYPFPTFFSLPRPRKLTSYIFEPHDPQYYESEEAFIETYYTALNKQYANLVSERKAEESLRQARETTLQLSVAC